MISATRYLVVLAMVLSATQVFAEDKTKEATAKYESGMAHYHLGEWDAAIDDWQAGFRARPLPEFLYNIAQAYRLSKRPDKALQFYQSYLSMSPNAPNADSVRQHIVALKDELSKQPPLGAAPSPMPPGGSAPPPNVETKAPTSNSSEVVPAGAPSTQTEVVTAAKPPRKKRTWIWGVVAGGVVLVAGAVVLGVVLGTASNESHVGTVRF